MMNFETVLGTLIRLTSKGEESGQTLVELGLMLAMMTLVALVGLTTLGGEVGAMWNWIGEETSAAFEGVLS